MKTEKEILDKIQWDPNENEAEYIIGYWDRFQEKIVEIPHTQFTVSEIPFHRVKVIKKDGKIIWERK